MNHDITHCKGMQCTLKKNCYRYLAYRELIERKEVRLASLFSKLPYKDNQCEYFITHYEKNKN